MSVGPSIGRQYAARAAAVETSLLDRTNVVNDFLNSDVGQQVMQRLTQSYQQYNDTGMPGLDSNAPDTTDAPGEEEGAPESNVTGGPIPHVTPKAGPTGGSPDSGGPIPDDIATTPPSEQEMADLLGMELPPEGEEFPDAEDDYPEGDDSDLPVDVSDDPKNAEDDLGPVDDEEVPFDEEPVMPDDEDQEESISDRLLSGRLSVVEAIQLQSSIVESGLLEPQGTYEIEQPSLEELYDALILRVNTLDLLDYFLASGAEDEVSALLFFFDPRMTKEQAGRLLDRFREIMPGSQVVQMPETEEDLDTVWVFVAMLYDAELVSPVEQEQPGDQIDMMGNSLESPFEDEEGAELGDMEGEDGDRIKLDLSVNAKKQSKDPLDDTEEPVEGPAGEPVEEPTGDEETEEETDEETDEEEEEEK